MANNKDFRVKNNIFVTGLGTSTFSGDVSIGDTITVQGAATFQDEVNLNSALNASSLSLSGNATISGNLTVSGTTTWLNSTNTQITDRNIVLNYSTGDSSGSANGAGITIQDAVNSTTDASLLWNTSLSAFKFSNTLHFDDGIQANFGTSSDLQIYHDGSNSIIHDNGTGNLKIRATNLRILNAAGTQNFISHNDGGDVKLYHAGNQKFATTSTGINVTGTGTFDNAVNIENSSGFGSIEVGGTSGAFVDLKSPMSDDYDLRIKSTGTGGEIDVASGELTIKRGGSARITTSASGIDVTGTAVVDGLNNSGTTLFNDDVTFVGAGSDMTWDNSADKLNFDDNTKATFGNSDDLQIYHDGSNSYISDTGTGHLHIQGRDAIIIEDGTSGENYIYMQRNNKVELYYDGAAKLATTSTGVSITGNASFSGDDRNLYFDSGTKIIGDHSIDGLQIRTGNTDPIVFKTNGNNTRYRIDGSGNFQVQTTTIIDQSRNLLNLESISLADSKQLNIGSGPDLIQYHNGSNSFIQNFTGGLYIDQALDNGNMIFRNDNGSGGLTAYMTLEGGNERVSFNKRTIHHDNVLAVFGSDQDLQIYHNGTDSFIDDAGSGDLRIRSNFLKIEKYTGETMATFNDDNSVALYFNNSKKLETTSTGIDVTGGQKIIGDSGDAGSLEIYDVDNGTASTDALRIVKSANEAYIFNRESSGGLNLGAGNTLNHVVITSGGNVGIGETSPSQKLHVAGNIYAASGFVNSSGYQLNGTYIVDSSRNLVNINTLELTGGTNYFKPRDINWGNYSFLGQTGSGAMTILGHNAFVDTTTNNTVKAKNSSWYASFIKMYYNQGITFHTSSSTVTAGDTLLSGTGTNSLERFKITSGGDIQIKTGDLQIGSTTVIDSSRNLTNIGTGSFSGTVSIDQGSSFSKLQIGTGRTGATENIGAVEFLNSSNTLKAQVYGSNDGKLRLTTNGNTVALTLDASQNATFAGNITATTGDIQAGSSGNNAFLRAYYGTAYMTLQGYGLEMNRTTSYIRPTTDGNKTLYVGGVDASLDWAAIHFRSLNGLYMTGTRFLTTTRDLENIGTISSGKIGVGANTASFWSQANSLVLDDSGNTGLTIKSATAGNGRVVFTDTTSTTAGLNDGGQIHYSHANDEMKIRTAGTDAITIDASQNVGIGTTSPAQKLEVAGRVRATTDPTFEVYESSSLRGGIQWDTASNFTNIFSVGGDIRFDRGGEKGRFTSSGLSVNGAVAISGNYNTSLGGYQINGVTVINSSRQLRNITAMRIGATEIIDSSRNLTNIGTISSGAITSSGNIVTTSSSAVIQTPRISMEADGTLDWGSAKQYGTLTWDTNKAIIKGQASSSLEFQTNNNGVAMTIDTSQRVGIGTGTPYSGARVQICGDDTTPSLNTTAIDDCSLIVSNSDNLYGTVFATDGTGKGYIQQRRMATATYYDLNLQPYGGNVGINETSPDSRLHITGTDGGWDKHITIEHNGSDIGKILVDTDGMKFRNMSSGNGFYFRDSSNATRMIINSSGNVGIGNTSPDEKLVVSGNIRTTGGVSVGDSSADALTFFGILKQGGSGGTTVIDSSRNLTNIGTISNTGRHLIQGGNLQMNNGDSSYRYYYVATSSGGGDFLLGQIRNNSSTDGAIEGTVCFAYDYGTTSESPKIHFSFAQRSGTARGKWWYEHDDDAAGSNNVKVVLIDDGSGNMYVWLRVGDFARITVSAITRQGSNWTNSGTLSSGTITTGTTLFDTSNDPTSEHHIGKLFAHGDSEIEGQLTIGSGNNLINAGNMTVDVAGDLTLDADGGDIMFKDGGTEKGRFGSSGFSVVGNTAISGNFNTSLGGYQVGGTTVIDSTRNLTNIGTISSGAITSTGALSVNSGTTDTAAVFTSSDTAVAVNFVASDNSMQIATSGTDGIIKNNGAGSFRLFNNGSERARIDSSGNVCIGNTSAGAKLDIRQDSGYAIRCENGSGHYFRVNSTGAVEIAGDISLAQQKKINLGGLAFARMNSSGNFELGDIDDDDRTVRINAFAGTSRIDMGDGSVAITGALSKSSGSFKIDHPLKPDTHHLVHSFVEGPQADNLYRGKIELVDGRAVIDLDEWFGMTPGTFLALNRDLQAFVSNEEDWDAVRAKVMGSQLIIECQNARSKASVSWMVVGERQDNEIYESTLTDDYGKIIVEPEKKVVE